MFYFMNCSNCFNVSPTLCWLSGPFHQPTVPTGCSLDSWFNLTEAVAGRVAVAGTVIGTVMEIRFIFLYFLYFLPRITFLYLLFSLGAGTS